MTSSVCDGATVLHRFVVYTAQGSAFFRAAEVEATDHRDAVDRWINRGCPHGNAAEVRVATRPAAFIGTSVPDIEMWTVKTHRDPVRTVEAS